MITFDEPAGVSAPATPASERAAGRRWPLQPLQVADLTAMLAVMVGLNLIRFGGPTASSYPLHEYLLAFLAFAIFQAVIAYFAGLYEPEPRLGSRPQLPRTAGAALFAMLFIGFGELMLGVYYLPRATLPAVPVASALVLAVNRRVARAQRRAREGAPRVLLVGVPREAHVVRAHLAESGAGAPEVAGQTVAARDLLVRVEAAGATDVLLLNREALDAIYPEPLLALERRGIGVLQRITACDTLLGLRVVREVAGMPFVALRSSTLPVSRARCKRLLEVAALLVLAPLLLPLLGAIAMYVRVVAGGPVLYRQQRVGGNGKAFAMVKFRTMRPDAEEGRGPVVSPNPDDRIIPACRWLRASRLDELAQLGNVLRGQMSIVGPRPERPELTAHYERLIPGYARRHEIPPGITGLAQIHGRYHTDPEYKLSHDLQYLANWSPVLDLQILCRTVWVVLSGRQ